MATIWKIVDPNGYEWELEDKVARQMITGGIMLRGETTTAITDLATTPTSIMLIGEEDPYTVQANDAVFYGSEEFVFDGTKWHKFGDRTGLGSLATKSSATGSFTPQGSVSQPTFSGTELTSTGKFTPQGSVSAPTITVTPSTDDTYVASSASSGGSVSNGTAASATMPVFSTSVSEGVMTIGWTPGSFTANTPTAVTLPTFSQKTVATGITSATASQPTFTGSEGDLSVAGTPAGTVSQPTFTGTTGTVTVS